MSSLLKLLFVVQAIITVTNGMTSSTGMSSMTPMSSSMTMSSMPSSSTMPSPATASSLPAQFFPSDGSKRVALHYGPYSVPPRSMQNGMKTFTATSAQKPCVDCLITWMQADLHYTNGTTANANTNLWLHHTLLTNVNAAGVNCPSQGEPFFASGNERTPINICVNGTDKAGYYVAPDATFGMITDLMNMGDTTAEAILTITYEYIPSPNDQFARVKPLWLDIGGCNGSSDQPAYANKTFQYSSPNWTATTDGRVTFIASHLHDGGTHLEVKNNGNVVCDSVAAYGQSPAYIDTMPMNMSMNGMPTLMSKTMSHISSMSPCFNNGSMKAGDKWSLTAFYNTSEYAPMTETNGKLEPIMGISIVYFVEANYVNASNGTEILKGSMSMGSTTGAGTFATAPALGGVGLLVLTFLLMFG